MARTPKTPALAGIDGPVRTCVGCRDRAAKGELLRVVAGRDLDGRRIVLPDPTGTAAGRGAHLHPTTACFDLAIRRRAFPRALKVREGLVADRVIEYLTLEDPP